MCVNDEQQYAEACYYIEKLNTPKGYQKDIIAVQGAESMAAGYNAGMDSSDAKYKVYMHQDVLIINRDFVKELLKVFENESIGMFGVMGCDVLPLHAQAVTAWNVGSVYHNCVPAKMLRRQNRNRTAIEVEALDGLMLATQQDVRWREDIFDGWDFYDVSQCFEMRRAGYQVVVPYQDQPWCYHDNNYSKMTRYYEYCNRFIKEYQKEKSFCEMAVSSQKQELDMLKAQSRNEISDLIDAGDRHALLYIFEKPENQGYLHLREFEALACIERLESASGKSFFWEEDMPCRQIREKMLRLKYMIKRVEYFSENMTALVSRMKEEYSLQAIKVVCFFYVADWEAVYQKIIEIAV